MRFAYHVMSSPLGLLFVVQGPKGLKFLEFMDRKSIKRMVSRHAPEYPGVTWEPSLLENKDVVEQLEGYFCGALTQFALPLDPTGSEFQVAVWKELVRIPFGETRTYGQIAKAIGQPKSARAVGLANNQNPLAVIVPCHRVIGANKQLTGYGGGLPRKKWLLTHEARFFQQAGHEGDLFLASSGRTGSRRDSR